MMSRRRESKAPRAHGRSVRQVTASDRKSDPERGVKLSGCNTRQPEGTDSCLDVLVVGKLFRGLGFFSQLPSLARGISVH